MSESLYMLELRPDPARLLAFLRDQNLHRYRDEDLGYGIHAWLTALFGELAPKPYRLFGGRDGRRLRLLGYTTHPPADLLDHAQLFATPSVLAVCDLADLTQHKTMPTHWPTGRRLGFEVLTCPVSRRDATEKDVFLRKAEALGQQEGLARAAVYGEWLHAQCLEAVDLEAVRLDGFRLVRMLRRNQRSENEGRSPQGLLRPQALLTGELCIHDSVQFARLLSRGIGRHRAFGYGMLLLRPCA